MLFRRLKIIVWLFTFFTLSAQGASSHAATFPSLAKRACAAAAQASSGTVLLFATLFACGTYLFGKETAKAYNNRLNYYHLRVALGGAITAACGAITLACLREAAFLKLIVENSTI
jgi:hypothetical protein